MRTIGLMLGLLGSGMIAAAGCGGDDDAPGDDRDAGDGDGDGDGDSDAGDEGRDGPDLDEENPNVHRVGDADRGREVFRFETFGNERFWTDAMRLPQGMIAADFTPVKALQAGLSVDIEALDAAVDDETLAAIAAELATDLSPMNAPILNDLATTVLLVNANAVVGVVPRDTNEDGTLDIMAGDKVGLSCAFCHTITDKSIFDLPNGGSIGVRVDGPAPHTINVGGSLAIAANSRAYYPLLQLALDANDGATIGRAPTGLTEDSTEAEVDAYLTNPEFYPAGMFDDAPDGNGAPMHNPPMFEAELLAPWGSEGGIQFLDDFSNLVYTVLLDPTILVTPGGRAFLNTFGGAAGDEIAEDYAEVLADTGVDGPFPLVDSTVIENPMGQKAPAGRRVDDDRLVDLNAYFNSLPAPGRAEVDEIAAARGRERFRQDCTSCHNVDQTRFVPSMIIDMVDIFPGYEPAVLAQRMPPFSPIQNSPGIFDDKMVVIDASQRGLERGIALPILKDLARKPVFLHDNSVDTLDVLLNPARGESEPHPFYLADEGDRRDMTEFLKSL